MKTCERYKLDPTKITHLVGDNASVNLATINLLRSAHRAKFGKLRYIRCLPHTLNLVIKAFLEPFEKAYKLSEHFGDIRRVLRAGGSNTANALAIEYAIAQNRLDFACTRWSSMIRVIMYVMTQQTAREIKKADKHLAKAAAEKADASAAADAAADEPPRSHWAALGELFDDLMSNAPAKKRSRKAVGGAGTADPVDDERDTSASEHVTATNFLERAAAYNSSAANFLAYAFVSILLASVPALMKLIQGGSHWAAELRDCDEHIVQTAEAAIRQLVAALTMLGTDSNLATMLDDAESLLRKQQELVLEQAAIVGGALVMGKETYDATDLPAARAQLRDAARKQVLKVALVASAEVKSCAALPKLNEALRAQDVKRRFMLREAPPSLPDGNGAMWEFLGVPVEDRTLPLAVALRSQWQLHMAAYKPPADDMVTPSIAVEYWRACSRVAPALSELAIVHLTVPLGSTSVERFFSHLTKMDTPHQRSMGAEVAANVLFLRANQPVMRQLMERHAAFSGLADADTVSGGKRTAAEAEEANALMAKATSAVHAAAHAAAPPAKKQKTTAAAAGAASAADDDDEVGDDDDIIVIDDDAIDYDDLDDDE